MITIKPLKIPNVKIITPSTSLPYDEVKTGQSVIWQWNACRTVIGAELKPMVIESEIVIERALSLRGMYYTVPPRTNSMFIRAISGSVYINTVDLREFSKTYRMSAGYTLTAKSKETIYIPEHFAWGMLSLSDNTVLLCKSSNYISNRYTKLINYADPQLNLFWPKPPRYVSNVTKNAAGMNEFEAQIQLDMLKDK